MEVSLGDNSQKKLRKTKGIQRNSQKFRGILKSSAKDESACPKKLSTSNILIIFTNRYSEFYANAIIKRLSTTNVLTGSFDSRFAC